MAGKTAYEKLNDRSRFRRRTAVEPVIGHFKSNNRMLRNYLKGVESDVMKRSRQIRDAFYFVLDLLSGSCPVKHATVQNY